MPDIEVNIDDLHEETSEEVSQTAAEEDRVPTGHYYGKLVRVKYLEQSADAPDPGRKYANALFELYDMDNPSKRMGSVYIRASWQVRKNARNGRLDGYSRTFADLKKAAKVTTSGVADVFNALKQQVVDLYVIEQFVVAEDDVLNPTGNEYISPKGEAWLDVPAGAAGDVIAEHYIGLGYESKLKVKSVRAVRVPF